MRCNVKVEGERCYEDAAYLVWFSDCDVCMVLHGFLGCFGHRCCVTHAAELRSEIYKFSDPDVPGSDASPIRLTGVSTP